MLCKCDAQRPSIMLSVWGAMKLGGLFLALLMASSMSGFASAVCTQQDYTGKTWSGQIEGSTCVAVRGLDLINQGTTLVVQIGIKNIGKRPIPADFRVFSLISPEQALYEPSLSFELYDFFKVKPIVNDRLNPGTDVVAWAFFQVPAEANVRDWLLRWNSDDGQIGSIGMDAYREGGESHSSVRSSAHDDNLDVTGQSAKNKPTPPRLIEAPDPVYPPIASRLKIQGVVVVSLTVDEQGRPEDLQLVKRQGYGLDQAALDAVAKYKFTPATLKGIPVPVLVNIEVNFRITASK